MMRKIMTVMAQVFMEIMTIAFVAMVGLMVNDVLYQYMDYWYAEEWQALAISVIGYMVIRYHAREARNNYLAMVYPKIEKLVGAIDRIEKTNKDEAA